MKALKLLSFVFVLTLLMASPAFAQGALLEGKAGGAGFGVALAIIGAGYGFGKIGSAALESMARQPEVSKDVRGSMIVIAALLEGATFFGLLICLLCLVL